jgi:hypothetical protein
MSEIAAALQKLALYRSHNTRASQEVFKQGLIILNSNAVQVGDDGTELSIPESKHLNILQDGLSWNNWHWQLWM